MATNPPLVHGFSDTFVTPLIRRWWIVVGLGVVMAVVGVVMLANPFGSVKMLAVLVALGLFVAGVDELAQAERHATRWPSYVLAAVWFVTALFAVAWPDATLWVLAVTVGIGLIFGGLAESFFAVRFHRELPMWGLALLDGLLSIGIGVAAVTWPGATIVVLAIILGLRVLVRGLGSVAFGVSLRRLNQMTSPHLPT